MLAGFDSWEVAGDTPPHHAHRSARAGFLARICDCAPHVLGFATVTSCVDSMCLIEFSNSGEALRMATGSVRFTPDVLEPLAMTSRQFVELYLVSINFG